MDTSVLPKKSWYMESEGTVAGSVRTRKSILCTKASENLDAIAGQGRECDKGGF